MPRTDMALPNLAFFQAKFETCKKSPRAFAKALGVSVSEGRKFLPQEKDKSPWVSVGTVVKVAAKLNASPLELVSVDPAILIPDDADYFRSLSHGWFIEADVQAPSRHRWHHEQVDWSRVERDPLANALVFCGTMKSEQGWAFRAQGKRAHATLATLECVDEARGLAFCVGYTHVHTIMIDGAPERVLCGAWIGWNVFRVPTVNRQFLSARELDSDRLKELQKTATLRSVLSSRPPPSDSNESAP